MRWSKLALSAQLLLASKVVPQNITATTVDVNGYPNSTLDATAWALIIFANFAGTVLRDVPVNQIAHQRNLASPDNPGVVKPNVDTLYSRVVLDLSQQDLVLTIPNISDGRYYVYPVYDPYGNSIAEIGVVNGNKPGDYLIRRAGDVAVQPGFVNSTGHSSPQYQGIINLPSTYGTMLIRLLVRSNTTDDLNILHAYQNASRLTPVARKTPSWAILHAPPLNTTSLNGSFLGIEGPSAQLTFASRLVQYNQPENYTDQYRVASILALAGLYNNAYHPDPSTNLTLAALIANATITATVTSPSNIREQGNSWQLSTPSTQGNFGLNYGSAAYVALAGYQQLTTRQTLYPGFRSLGFTTAFTLPPNTSLLVTFSGKPRLHPAGFWSLTVYGDDQYLIPNALSRFEVGDRTHSLTYPDGSPVYGPQSDPNRDGPFHVLVQPADIAPPANWTGNWLPCSPTFTWILRWYVAQDAMTNGSYVYPRVENTTMIRA